jgi:hypothetical protein
LPAWGVRNEDAPEVLMARAVSAQTRKKFIRDGQKVEDWGPITVVDALADRKRVFRCLEWRARVRPHKASDAQEAHLEHLREFAGCPSSAAWDGIRRENAAALA